MATRKAQAVWRGDLAAGSGQVHSETGSVDGSYSAASRFESGVGTNPEELLGAAHAACFSMALSHELAEAGHRPNAVNTTAKVEIEKTGGGFAITQIVLSTTAEVPGIDETTFQSIAENAKINCPVSQALRSVPIELEAVLANR
jgi:osmotically inducible protein OsmC